MDALEDRRLLTAYYNISSSSPVQEPLTTSESKYASFSISLVGPPGASGSVSWSASSNSQAGDTATAGADYQPLSGTVNVSVGSPQPIQIPIYYDVLSEPNERFRVTLSNPTGGYPIMSGTGYATIIDAPVNPMYVSITPMQSAVVEANTAQFSIARSSTVGPLTVYYQVDPASTVAQPDYILDPAGSVAFADGESTALVTVTAIKDTALEFTETLTLELLSIAPGTVGPSQYLISGTGEASMNFHDGYHGIVNTPYTVEYQDMDGVWHVAPNSETLWVDESLRWTPTIPSEVAPYVNTVTWLMRPHNDPQAAWVSFGTGTITNPLIGGPGLGHWDITFQAFYDIVSYFMALHQAKGRNDVAGVVWEKGDPDQRFTYASPESFGPDVFPEKNTPGGPNLNTVKVVVTLAQPCANSCVVNLKPLDPDHDHDPENANDEFDPNDTYATGPGGANNINPLDNRQSVLLESGEPPTTFTIGMTLQPSSLTFGPTEQVKHTIGTITHPQPGNNFIAAALPRAYDVTKVSMSDDDGITVVRRVTGPPLQFVEVPWKYHSDVLTVWRTLWIELDSMRAPNAMAEGPFDPDPAADDDPYLDPGNAVIDLLAPEYARAYIDVKLVDPADDDTDGEDIGIGGAGYFVHNLDNGAVALGRAAAMADIADANENAFWVGMLVGGYEGDALEDGDDESEKIVFGFTLYESNVGYVFHEALRDGAGQGTPPTQSKDLATLERRITLHETGHFFGLLDYNVVGSPVTVMNYYYMNYGADWQNHYTNSELGRIQGQPKPQAPKAPPPPPPSP